MNIDPRDLGYTVVHEESLPGGYVIRTFRTRVTTCCLYAPSGMVEVCSRNREDVTAAYQGLLQGVSTHQTMMSR